MSCLSQYPFIIHMPTVRFPNFTASATKTFSFEISLVLRTKGSLPVEDVAHFRTVRNKNVNQNERIIRRRDQLVGYRFGRTLVPE